MIKNLFVDYKKNKLTSIITIIAIAIFIFSSSIIYTILKDSLNQTKDVNKLNDNLININFTSNKEINFNEIGESLFSKFKTNTIIVNLGREVIENKKITNLFAIDFEKKLHLNINILEGRNLKKEDLSEKKAIIGKKIKDCITIVNGKKYIKISDEDYEVIGIVGNEETNSPYDLFIYIPLTNLPCHINSNLYQDFNFCVTNNNFEKNIEPILKQTPFKAKYYFKEFEKRNIISTFISNYDFSIKNIITILFTNIFTIVNLIIISNLWISNKKYEIALKKAMGASNKAIIKEFFYLVLSFSIFASIMSFIFEFVFSKVIREIFYIYLNINIKTIISISFFSLVIVSIVTLYQIKRITKISLINYIQD